MPRPVAPRQASLGLGLRTDAQRAGHGLEVLGIVRMTFPGGEKRIFSCRKLIQFRTHF